MPTPVSRSAAETLAYLDLSPCKCGETRCERQQSLRFEGPKTIKHYEIRCAACGAARREDVVEPEWPFQAPDGEFAFGPPGTISAILDPGQWLFLSDRAAKSVPADPRGAREQHALAYAIAALDEVLRFVPPGAGEHEPIPADRFVSPLGRAVLAREPRGTFSPARLSARRGAYVRILDEMRPRPAPRMPSPIPSPGSLVTVDMKAQTISLPTFVLGASATAFVVGVRAATGGSLNEAAGGDASVTWLPMTLGPIRGFTTTIHLYAFDDDPRFAPLLSSDLPHARGVVFAGAASGEPGLLAGLFAASVACPAVVFGGEPALAAWRAAGGAPPIACVDPSRGVMDALRTIAKEMLTRLRT